MRNVCHPPITTSITNLKKISSLHRILSSYCRSRTARFGYTFSTYNIRGLGSHSAVLQVHYTLFHCHCSPCPRPHPSTPKHPFASTWPWSSLRQVGCFQTGAFTVRCSRDYFLKFFLNKYNLINFTSLHATNSCACDGCGKRTPGYSEQIHEKNNSNVKSTYATQAIKYNMYSGVTVRSLW